MNNKKVPKLRFPEFSGEWKYRKLNNIAKLSSGGTPNRSKSEYWGGDIPWITTGEINFNIISKSTEKISEEGLNNSSAKVFPENTILIAMYGQGKTRGKSAILGIKATTNQACAAIMPTEYTNNIFLYHYISGQYENLRSLCNEGSQKNLSLGILGDVIVGTPAKKEQEKIAKFFTLIDAKIEQQKQKVDSLKDYKKGIMQKIFTQEIRFKKQNGEEYPKWESVVLNKIGDTYSGLSGKTKENFGIGESKYVVYKNVFDNIISKYDAVELVEINKSEKQNKVKKGDLLFTTSSETPNEVGMISCWNYDEDNIYLNSFCFGYRLLSLDKYSSIFMAYLLRSEVYRRKISILAQGSTRYNISKTELMKMNVIIPSFDEQLKIVDLLMAFEGKIEKEQAKLDYLNTWKKGLLQQMFV